MMRDPQRNDACAGTAAAQSSSAVMLTRSPFDVIVYERLGEAATVD
jgi:hypothetical protein